MEPFNYRAMLPDPTKALEQSMMAGAQMVGQRKTPQEIAMDQQRLRLLEAQVKSAQQEAATAPQLQAARLLGEQNLATERGLAATRAQRELDFQKNILELSRDPSSWNQDNIKTAAMQAAAINPAAVPALRSLMNDMPKTASIVNNAASEVFMAVQSGKPEVARGLLEQRISAVNNSLDKNPNDKELLAAKDFLGSAYQELNQDSSVAGLKAGIYLANNDPGRLKSLQETLKSAADISETVAKTVAEKAKADFQIAQKDLLKIEASIKASGDLSPEERMKQENKMREDFQSQPLVRNFLIKKENLGIIKGAEDTAEGDRSRITSFIKMLDPTSVVSVTESGQITGSTPYAIINSWIAKVNGGGILGDDTRKSIKRQAEQNFKPIQEQVDNFKKQTSIIAKRYKINPENIVSIFDSPKSGVSQSPSGQTSIVIDGIEMKVSPRK